MCEKLVIYKAWNHTSTDQQYRLIRKNGNTVCKKFSPIFLHCNELGNHITIHTAYTTVTDDKMNLIFFYIRIYSLDGKWCVDLEFRKLTSLHPSWNIFSIKIFQELINFSHTEIKSWVIESSAGVQVLIFVSIIPRIQLHCSLTLSLSSKSFWNDMPTVKKRKFAVVDIYTI